jgi:hypothetical protein
MELLNPDTYKKYYAKRNLSEITDELKRVETKLAEIDAANAFGQSPNIQDQNAQDTSFLAQIQMDEDFVVNLTDTDKVKVASSGENSEKSIYMAYQRALTSLIKEKNEYMNEEEFKAKLRVMNVDDLMITRNRLVDDINRYYKETNSMRTKNMLMALPFTKWLVKKKNVNENTDSLEVIMKKEEYVKYIEQLQADPKHFEDLLEKQMQASSEPVVAETPVQTAAPVENSTETQQIN